MPVALSRLSVTLRLFGLVSFQSAPRSYQRSRVASTAV